MVSSELKPCLIGYDVVLAVGDQTIRYECSSGAEAVTVHRVAICNVWRMGIAFSEVDIKTAVVGFRLGAHRFVVTEYNCI